MHHFYFQMRAYEKSQKAVQALSRLTFLLLWPKLFFLRLCLAIFFNCEQVNEHFNKSSLKPLILRQFVVFKASVGHLSML